MAGNQKKAAGKNGILHMLRRKLGQAHKPRPSSKPRRRRKKSAPVSRPKKRYVFVKKHGPNGAAPPRRRRKHGRLTLNYILFGIVGMVVLSVLCYTVFFKVYKINVTGGMGRYTSQEIISASGIQMKTSLFKVDEKKVFVTVNRALPYVEGVQVKKRFPTRVELIVDVVEPAGAVKTSEGNYLYINAQGKILENDVAANDPKYPLIAGITPTATDVGMYVLNQSSEQINMLGELIREIKATGLEDVTYISVADRLNMRIMLQNRLLVELGTEKDLNFKIQYVKKAMEKLDASKKGVLDVTLVTQINRAYFHEERDLLSLVQEADQRAQQSGNEIPEETGIKVDPDTGKILIGPSTPLDKENASSGEEVGSSESGETSPNGEGSSLDGKDMSSKPEGSSSDGKSASSKPEGSSSDGKSASSKPEGSSSDGKSASSKPEGSSSDGKSASSKPEGSSSDGKSASSKDGSSSNTTSQLESSSSKEKDASSKEDSPSSKDASSGRKRATSSREPILI